MQENRRRKLYSRRQKIDEPVETYVQEMINLAKQVFPNEDESLSVLRAKQGLVPDLRLFIGECSTVNELIEKAGIALSSIRASDRINNRHTRLPPLHAYASDDNSGYENEQFGGGQGYNAQNHRYFQNQSSSLGQSSYQHQRPFNRDNDYSHVNRDQSQNSQMSFRPRVNSLPSNVQSFPRDMSRIKCHACNNFGTFCT